jgi:hypothetical protein
MRQLCTRFHNLLVLGAVVSDSTDDCVHDCRLRLHDYICMGMYIYKGRVKHYQTVGLDVFQIENRDSGCMMTDIATRPCGL